jgi:hypothetical protein
MFHVKPRQIQPGASVPRRTDGAPGVRSIGQHLRWVARCTVAAPQSVSRAAAPRAAQVLAVLAVVAPRARCPATRDSALLARTPPAGTSLAMRLPVKAPETKAVQAKAVLAAARSQASQQTQVPALRARPANAVPADGGRPVPTMVQPPVPCLLGQNQLPRCPAVQFLVGRYYSSARYPAAQNSAPRSRAGPGLGAGCPARCRPGRCPGIRIPALRSAGRASIPARTARIPAAARAQPNRTGPVPHRAASPFPASSQTLARWTGRPEMTCPKKGSPPPGLPTAAGLRTVYPGPTDARTSDPGTAGPATAREAVAHPRTATPGTAGPDATAPGTADPGPTDPGPASPRTRGPGTSGPGKSDLPTAHPGTTNSGTAGPRVTDRGPVGPGTTDLTGAHPGTTALATASPGTTDLGTTGPWTSGPGTGRLGTTDLAACWGTKDSGTAGPEVTDPGTTDPGTTDLTASHAGAADSEMSGPGPTDPGLPDRGTTGPGMGGPGTTDLTASHPGAADSGTAGPGPTDRELTDPGTTGPGTSGLETSGQRTGGRGTIDLMASRWGATGPGTAGPEANDPGKACPGETELAAAHPRTTGSGMAGLERTVRKPAPGAPMQTGRLRPDRPAAASPGPCRRARAASTRAALARTALSQTGPLRAVASMASDPGHRPQTRHPPGAGR